MTDPLSALIEIARCRRLFGAPPWNGVEIGRDAECVRMIGSIEGATVETAYAGIRFGTFLAMDRAQITVDGVLFWGTSLRDATEAETAEWSKHHGPKRETPKPTTPATSPEQKTRGKLKVYGWTSFPRGGRQGRCIVVARSKAEARRIAKLRPSDEVCETANANELAAAHANPTTVLWQPLDTPHPQRHVFVPMTDEHPWNQLSISDCRLLRTGDKVGFLDAKDARVTATVVGLFNSTGLVKLHAATWGASVDDIVRVETMPETTVDLRPLRPFSDKLYPGV